MNTLELLRTLEESLDPQVRRDRLRELNELLMEDHEVVGAFLRTYYTSFLKHILPPFITGGDQPFFTLDIYPHLVTDEEVRLALFLAFVQDHEASDETLDEKVLQALVKRTQALGLLPMFDDICVNFLQWNASQEDTP